MGGNEKRLEPIQGDEVTTDTHVFHDCYLISMIYSIRCELAKSRDTPKDIYLSTYQNNEYLCSFSASNKLHPS